MKLFFYENLEKRNNIFYGNKKIQLLKIFLNDNIFKIEDENMIKKIKDYAF